jgi:hypothetical protein
MADINSSVIAFAKKSKNKRIYVKEGKNSTKGECWDLAEKALIDAGAKTSTKLTPNFSATADYIWGTKIAQLSTVKPGDILQFKNYKCTWSSTEEDGSGVDADYSAKHHTAIVMSKPTNGAVKVLHQNYNNKKTVHETTFQLSSKEYKKGKTAYKYTVTGKIMAYRPIKK